MKKILITILVTLGTQGIVGSEVRVLDGGFSEGTNTYTKRKGIFEVCFDKKLFISDWVDRDFGRGLRAVMENTPHGISQKKCEFQDTTVLPGGLTLKTMNEIAGRKRLPVNGRPFKLCVSDVVFYFVYTVEPGANQSARIIQAFTDGRAETC